MRYFLFLIAALFATAATAQISNPPLSATVDTTGFATTAQLAAKADQSALTAMAATIPVPASATPPGVTDTGTLGTMTGIYALANHTHASKARKGRVLVPSTGTLALTFSSAFSAIPVCAVTAEATAGDTNVVNAQIDGTPTVNGMTIRVNRTAQSVVALIGLTVLSVPTQVATYAHYVCLEP